MDKPVRRLSFIEDNIGKLRKSEVKVAEYIPLHADRIIHFSLNELADNVGVSEPTVIRFCRALGFSGWQEFKIYLAQAIIPLILLLITAFGVGMILSTMAVFFRDLEYLWSVGLMIIMYASAIFYKPEKLLKSGFGWILKCNPLYLLIHNFRQAVFGMPMNMKFLAASIVFAIVSVIVGLIFFYKKQDEFILHI